MEKRRLRDQQGQQNWAPQEQGPLQEKLFDAAMQGQPTSESAVDTASLGHRVGNVEAETQKNGCSTLSSRHSRRSGPRPSWASDDTQEFTTFDVRQLIQDSDSSHTMSFGGLARAFRPSEPSSRPSVATETAVQQVLSLLARDTTHNANREATVKRSLSRQELSGNLSMSRLNEEGQRSEREDGPRAEDVPPAKKTCGVLQPFRNQASSDVMHDLPSGGGQPSVFSRARSSSGLFAGKRRSGAHLSVFDEGISAPFTIFDEGLDDSKKGLSMR